MQTLPFSQLHVFLTVARHRSFSGAARELGVSTSAVSQAVKQLEDQLQVALLTRTTRAVAPTEAGQRLVETAAPALKQAIDALVGAAAKPGEVVGRLKISVGATQVPLLIMPVLPEFRRRYPRIEVEIVVEERFVDIVGEGYDAGVRLDESIERDMVHLRLTDPFRFVVVASPAYLAAHGTPCTPEDLLRHDCITPRMATSGALYAWELERGRKTWRVPVRGIVTNDQRLTVELAEMGLGLAYTFEPYVAAQLRASRLEVVLDDYACEVPGFFLYFANRAQSSPALRLFIEVIKDVLGTRPKRALRSG